MTQGLGVSSAPQTLDVLTFELLQDAMGTPHGYARRVGILKRKVRKCHQASHVVSQR